MTPAQAGFRPGYSTIDNCFVLHTAICKALSKPKGKLYAVFIDFRAAFDSIDRDLLFSKLYKLGLNGRFFHILFAMYYNVKSIVKWKNGFTRAFACSKGVRQGCNLSPTLFSLFINDLPGVLNEAGYPGIKINGNSICSLLYADDLVIFSENALCLQKIINVFETYCTNNKLVVNRDKTKVVVFRNGGHLAKHESWHYQHIKLETVNMYNYLGLNFTPKGVWKATMEILGGSAMKATFSLKTILPRLYNLPVSDTLYIYDTKILPILTYGAEIWGAYPRDSVISLYNNFHKYVLGIPYKSVNIVALRNLGDRPCVTLL